MQTAAELSHAIEAKELSALELMVDTLARIKTYNPGLNAIVAMADTEYLLDQARAADQALAQGEYWGWMHGLPHAVKDLAALKGFVTSSGSPLFVDNLAPEDDIFVHRIRQQGAIFIGKTNVPEFGLGSQSYNPVHGTTANAFNDTLTAGGSSGGAAAALARGLVAVADGSDMMGSLRNPAAYNNVVGFRPSLGRIPVDNGTTDLFFDQLATNGPMARSVEDVILLFTTMAGKHSKAPLSMQPELKHPALYKPLVAAQLKLAWLADYDGYLPMEPGVLSLCEAALSNLSVSGTKVESVSVDFDMASLWQCWLTLRHWTISNGFAGLSEPAKKQIKPEALWEIEQGARLTGEQVYFASKKRSKWYRCVEALFQRFDIVALPSAQVFPFAKNQHWPKQIATTPMDTYHRWMEVVIGASLSGCPTISLPAGFDSQGRPMGIQFMAAIGEDEKLLEFALSYEAINPWSQFYA